MELPTLQQGLELFGLVFVPHAAGRVKETQFCRRRVEPTAVLEQTILAGADLLSYYR